MIEQIVITLLYEVEIETITKDKYLVLYSSINFV